MFVEPHYQTAHIYLGTNTKENNARVNRKQSVALYSSLEDISEGFVHQFEEGNEGNSNNHRMKSSVSADDSVHEEEGIELQVLKQPHIPSVKLR